jgi:hypothetical protein
MRVKLTIRYRDGPVTAPTLVAMVEREGRSDHPLGSERTGCEGRFAALHGAACALRDARISFRAGRGGEAVRAPARGRAGRLTPFQVFACDGAAGLPGEVDLTCQGGFARARGHVQPAPDRCNLVFDMPMIRFRDHRAQLALDAYARKCQVPVIVGSPPVASRIAGLAGLEVSGSARRGVL